MVQGLMKFLWHSNADTVSPGVEAWWGRAVNFTAADRQIMHNTSYRFNKRNYPSFVFCHTTAVLAWADLNGTGLMMCIPWVHHDLFFAGDMCQIARVFKTGKSNYVFLKRCAVLVGIIFTKQLVSCRKLHSSLACKTYAERHLARKLYVWED